MDKKFYKVTKSNKIVSEQEVIDSAVQRALSENRVKKVGDKLMVGEVEVTPEQIKDSLIKKYPNIVTKIEPSLLKDIGSGIVKRAERGTTNIPQNLLEVGGIAPTIRVAQQIIPGGEQPLSTGSPIKTGAAIAGDIGQIASTPIGGIKGLGVGAVQAVGMDISGITDAIRYISSNIENAPSNIQGHLNSELNKNIKILRENIKLKTPKSIEAKENAMNEIKGIQGLLKVITNKNIQPFLQIGTQIPASTYSALFELAPTFILGSLYSKGAKGTKSEKDILTEYSELHNAQNIIDTLKNKEYDKIQQDLLSSKKGIDSSNKVYSTVKNGLELIRKNESRKFDDMKKTIDKIELDTNSIDVLKNNIKNTLNEFNINPEKRAVTQEKITVTTDAVTNLINKYYNKIDKAANLGDLENISKNIGDDVDKLYGGKRSKQGGYVLKQLDDTIEAFKETNKLSNIEKEMRDRTMSSYAEYKKMEKNLEEYLGDKAKPEDFIDNVITGGGSRGLESLNTLIKKSNEYMNMLEGERKAVNKIYDVKSKMFKNNQEWHKKNIETRAKRELDINNRETTARDARRNIELLVYLFIKDKSLNEFGGFNPNGFAKAINTLNKASDGNIENYFSGIQLKDINKIKEAAELVKTYENLPKTKELSPKLTENIAISLDKLASGIPGLREFVNAARFDSIQAELNLLNSQNKLTSLMPVGQEGRVVLRTGLTTTKEQQDQNIIPLVSEEEKNWQKQLEESKKRIKERNIKQKTIKYIK